MENNYIFKDKENNLYLYCYNNGSILKKKYNTNNKWFFEDTIISNVKENFTFNVSFDDEIYIFCQDNDYNVHFLKGRDNVFESQIILENTTGEKNEVFFYSRIDDDVLTLIFNTPKDNKDTAYLYMQKMQNNIWQKAEIVDKCMPIKNKYFDFYSYNGRDIIFYKNCDVSNNIGYRTFSVNGISNFYKYHSTNYDIIDMSNLIINDELYFAYVVKSSFSYQLFFRRTNSNGFDDAIVVSEGQNIDNIVLFYSDKLYIFYTSRDSVYYIYSDNLGNSFSKVKKFKDESSTDLVKAKFVSKCNFDMCINDIYISRKEPRNIKILPNIYPNFYDDYKKPMELIKKLVVQPNINNQNINNHNTNHRPEESQKVYYENLADLSNEDFYKILLEKKRKKDLEKKQDNFEQLSTNDFDEMEKLRKENEKLKKALKGLF